MFVRKSYYGLTRPGTRILAGRNKSDGKGRDKINNNNQEFTKNSSGILMCTAKSMRIWKRRKSRKKAGKGVGDVAGEIEMRPLAKKEVLEAFHKFELVQGSNKGVQAPD